MKKVTIFSFIKSKRMFKISSILVMLAMGIGQLFAQSNPILIVSPDQQLQVAVWSSGEGAIHYQVKHFNKIVIDPSVLGFTLKNMDLSAKLSFVSASATRLMKDSYQMVYAKKTKISYVAHQRILNYVNENKQAMSIVFQVANDAVAFQYRLIGSSSDVKQVLKEGTTFNFPSGTRTWLQPMQAAKTGWEATNPAYEEHYKADVAIESVAENNTGWVYPALFKSNGSWVLLTEAGLDSNYCATRLLSSAKAGEFTIGFPDPREIMPGKGFLPQGKLPFASPWRIITIGSLKTIIESTAGTDLAKPARFKNIAYVKPGKASWSWINSKDNFIIYDEQKKYIDFAADMKWQYCLIDVNWDTKIGYAKIQELADYATTKNVGLLLWYNSAGNWNSVKYTPKNLLLSHESRMKEFARIRQMGIKGIKVDFFAGDGQSVIKYYIDILHDAASYGLMVNFHGATLPRGWARTFPNLLTAEAVRGVENVTFQQKEADMQAEICTILPFTRNAFDPMDYTPMNLYKVLSGSKRRTSNGFELALSVLFLSGIQHYAESPEGMAHVDMEVKNVLRELPTHWDEVRFLDGYPGKYVVIARRSGKKWFIAGINAQTSAQRISLNLADFGKSNAKLVSDGKDAFSFQIENIAISKTSVKDLEMKPAGGFLVAIE